MLKFLSPAILQAITSMIALITLNGADNAKKNTTPKNTLNVENINIYADRLYSGGNKPKQFKLILVTS